jgi:hypothetical protein
VSANRAAVDESVRNRHTRAVVAGLTVGCFLTWNVSNVGAVADPLAETYGVSLGAVQGASVTKAPFGEVQCSP